MDRRDHHDRGLNVKAACIGHNYGRKNGQSHMATGYISKIIALLISSTRLLPQASLVS